ncbi:MAG TPA: hypothetical protein VKU00_06585 [Chthonomonadaceae bacterium]|nr:hypothetical protein [Chthonomonadaceae bacterium]
MSKECYTQVGPVLQSAGGKLTPEVRNAYLDWAEKTVLQELRQNNQAVPESCLAEVRKDGMLRDAMFGSVFPPDPSILQNYAQLRTQLGDKILTKYRSLVVAVSVAKRIKDVEKPGGNAEIGRDYQPGFWVDESLQFPGSNEEKEFTRRIADFMKQSQIAAADLFQNADLQEQLKANLAQHAIPAPFLAGVKKTVWFGERLKYAMVLLGQRPAARDPKPKTIDWLRHLIEINEAKPTSTPTIDGRPMPWPLFPIASAPWPLLMPLAHPVPLSEANYIWSAFQGEYGPDRYHTYGPYRGDDDLIANSLNPSKWFWDAWPDRIVHGGMCVPISKGTVDLYTSLNKPAMWAGQPGHANLISFQYVNGAWTAEIEQAFAGGPDATTAQWYFDEDPGTQIRYRDLYFWAGAEYHLGLALAMNVGLKPYMDTRIGANLFRALPEEDKRTLGVKLLRDALLSNPFNPEIWYRLAEHNPDPMLGVALEEAAMKGQPGRLSLPPGPTSPEMHGSGGASDQYWRTVAQFETQLALLIHPAPRKIEDMRRVYTFLKTAPGVGGNDLVAYAEKYVENHPADPGADNPEYDQNLAKGGDAYGQLRMGQRYRDGDGVPQNNAKAVEFFTRAAAQGDVGAVFLLGTLNPAIPGDRIAVTPSSVYDQERAAKHLVDGSGIWGAAHDNEENAKTMWHSVGAPASTPPAKGLSPSPAWVRFDFARPTRFASIQIWNHNQARLTDRGFRKTRIYGSSDGTTWILLTPTSGIELPQASGMPLALPTTVPNPAADRPFKAVIIAAEAAGGNYGSAYYGLSAVHFVAPPLSHVIPAKAITVTPSSVFTAMQAAQHLVDGSGMLGALHDNAEAAQTMWHTADRPAAQPPLPGLPPSPAWVRFDFAQPQEVETILIWNHNQANLTDRGFRKVRIYGSSDGVNWHALTPSQTMELPRANGSSLVEPTAVPISLNEALFKSILIAADEVDGNYGGSCYGLSAVRFVVRH